ncbi:MAG TPA: hypothetical protein PKD09_14275 [Aggregatilinea sp.]|uniref:hypothetical protein n=1 Tax=Aggregatilinea sp. TaxID=2806333 RepID=UPI002C190FA3|nr:hypothetical protein [Aggregatilinea sp.]HML22813.1 hypothetical protein [Aggregatilinea sp.]
MTKRKSKRRPGQAKGVLHPSISAIVGSTIIAALVLYAAVTGEVWIAAGWGMALMLVFLVGLAIYFWGVLMFGGTLSALKSDRSPIPWSFGDIETAEYNIDPGLELMSAGVLAYYTGKTRFETCFRTVPARGLRAIRPFVMARTGLPELRTFEFELVDTHDQIRFRQQVDCYLEDGPELVMTPDLAALPVASDERGEIWSWRVRSGVTILTTFSIYLSDDAPSREALQDDAGGHHGLLRALLTEFAAREAAVPHDERLQEGV